MTPAESPGAAVLAGASRVVAAVTRGASADDALAAVASHPQRAAIRAVSLGTLRWYLRLHPAIEPLLEGRRIVPELRALLACAVHQIEYSNNAPQLTVHQSVDATRLLGQPRAAGLVNALLRRYLRERDSLLAQVDSSLAGRTAHPAWLVEALREAWGEHAIETLEANNAHPPFVLRVNRQHRSVADYLEELRSDGIEASAVEWSGTAVLLARPVPVDALPGFAEGHVSVQDAGAQLAAMLVAPSKASRVLDACAAPGGKTGHLLELAPTVELVAIDVSAARLTRVRENLDRLGFPAGNTRAGSSGTPREEGCVELVAADVGDPASFWDGRPFDRILVDAPCSSTGVIRRHPDIKLLRRASDIGALASTQRKILRSCFGMLAPGGRLVYSTCSVLPEENEAVVGDLLGSESRAAEVPVERLLPQGLPPGAMRRAAGFQLLPGSRAGTDGFYYACVEKTTAGT